MAGSGRRWEEDTALGGRQVAFPATPGSAVLGVRSDDPVTRGRAFSALVRAYWKPVYKRIRRRWGKSNEEAKDLTQSFFARAFERGVFDAYRPQGPPFRAFVRSCLDNFVSNAERERTAAKRGGGGIALSLGFEEAEAELARAERVEEAPDERVFDEDWARGLFDMSIAVVRSELEEQGRSLPLRAFERYDLVDEPERPTYAELAEELGVKATDVTNYLHGVRKRLRVVVLAKLREITVTDEEFRSEALELLGIDPAKE